MPLYDLQCQKCMAEFEAFLKVSDAGKVHPACPSCGSVSVKRIFVPGHGGIKCDSIADVKWLPSACANLDPDRPIGSRTEWKRHLKEKGIGCKA